MISPEGRNPVYFEEVEVTDTPYTLKDKVYNYAVCQFQEITFGDYESPSRVARYKMDGNIPTTVSGFVAGDGDTRIFSKGELLNGVQLLSSEAGVTFLAVIQYYK